MKRNNSQSLSRQIKRGHVRFIASDFVKNADGTPKMIKQRRLKNSGKFINV